jgi:hypothetical protein
VTIEQSSRTVIARSVIGGVTICRNSLSLDRVDAFHTDSDSDNATVLMAKLRHGGTESLFSLYDPAAVEGVAHQLNALVDRQS